MGRHRAHHQGTYARRAAAVRAAATANPDTLCWRCGRTLAEHEPHRDGRAPFWTAGHLIDGQIEGQLAPEASTCNFAAGAALGNATRRPDLNTSRDWSQAP